MLNVLYPKFSALIGDDMTRVRDRMKVLAETTSDLSSSIACDRAWYLPCPRYWSVSADGATCVNPDPDDECAAMEVPRTPRSKATEAERCHVKWPCKSECVARGLLTDWQPPAPLGWVLSDDGRYRADGSYRGPCVDSVDLSDHTVWMKSLWSDLCDAPWPCLSDEDEDNDEQSTRRCPVGWSIERDEAKSLYCSIPEALYPGPCYYVQDIPQSDAEMSKIRETCGQSSYGSMWARESVIHDERHDRRLCRDNEAPEPCPAGWTDLYVSDEVLCLSPTSLETSCAPLLHYSTAEWSNAMMLAFIEDCILQDRHVGVDEMKSAWNCSPVPVPEDPTVLPKRSGPVVKVLDDRSLVAAIRGGVDSGGGGTAYRGGAQYHYEVVDGGVEQHKPLEADWKAARLMDVMMKEALQSILQTYWSRDSQVPEGVSAEQKDAVVKTLTDEISMLSSAIGDTPGSSISLLQVDNHANGFTDLNEFVYHRIHLRATERGLNAQCIPDYNRKCPSKWTYVDTMDVCAAPRGDFSPCSLVEMFPRMNPQERAARSKLCHVDFPCLACEEDYVTPRCPSRWRYIDGICLPPIDEHGVCHHPSDFTKMTAELRRQYSQVDCDGQIHWPCIDAELTIVDDDETCRFDVESSPCPLNFAFVDSVDGWNACSQGGKSIQVPAQPSERLAFARRFVKEYAWPCIDSCKTNWRSECPYGYSLISSSVCQLTTWYTPLRVEEAHRDAQSDVVCGPRVGVFSSDIEKMRYSSLCHAPWPCLNDRSTMCDMDFVRYDCPVGWTVNDSKCATMMN
eukprot:GHVH01009445.1.p1 GENE.GHVH01009445.1~~GHVH01009445.1.p1  ORF type:complete len:792 (+),score=97.19 GHVH01009445.1:82-2457(+)